MSRVASSILSAHSFFCFPLHLVSFAQIAKMQYIWALCLSLLASIALAQPATSTSPSPAQSTACGTIVNDPSNETRETLIRPFPLTFK
jgi:hypothetical protein